MPSIVPVVVLSKYNNYIIVQDDKLTDVVRINPTAVSGHIKGITVKTEAL